MSGRKASQPSVRCGFADVIKLGLRNETQSVVTVNSLCGSTQARRAVHLQGVVPKMHPRPSRWLTITFLLSNPCLAGAAVGEEKRCERKRCHNLLCDVTLQVQSTSGSRMKLSPW